MKILIIDDEPQIRKLLQISLESSGYEVLEAINGTEGIQLTKKETPDVILLDLGLPDMNGHVVMQKLRTWFTAPIIILSVKNEEEDIVHALDNGANDYLTKPFRTGELLARIRLVLRNVGEEMPKLLLQFDDLTINIELHEVKLNEERIKLTATEYDMLVLMAKHEGSVLTHQFILKSLWGTAYQTETQYLRVFVAQLRKKIEKNPNRPVHIITESGVGYRFQ
ncbi:response regulator transcription factor [Zhouia sp. PK063]|uniref:response regulator transcription factor n=1 Tax=Zhouia sp. PK063 TaxID=3373602 RepID=UPI003788C6E4